MPLLFIPAMMLFRESISDTEQEWVFITEAVVDSKHVVMRAAGYYLVGIVEEILDSGASKLQKGSQRTPAERRVVDAMTASSAGIVASSSLGIISGTTGKGGKEHESIGFVTPKPKTC